MAEKPGQEKSLHQLRQEIAHSRDRLARDLSGLRYELDFPLKLRKSFQSKTAMWIAAAAVLGVILAVMPARTKKVRITAKGKGDGEETKKGILGAGLAMGAARIAVGVLRPVVISYLSKRVGGYASGARHDRKW